MKNPALVVFGVMFAQIGYAAEPPERPADRDQTVSDWEVADQLQRDVEEHVVGVATVGGSILASGCEGRATMVIRY